jgi:hypothetical protein
MGCELLVLVTQLCELLKYELCSFSPWFSGFACLSALSLGYDGVGVYVCVCVGYYGKLGGDRGCRVRRL